MWRIISATNLTQEISVDDLRYTPAPRNCHCVWFEDSKNKSLPTYWHNADLQALFNLEKLGEDKPRVLIDEHRGDDWIDVPRRFTHDDQALVDVVVHNSGHGAGALGVLDLDQAAKMHACTHGANERWVLAGE